MLGYVNDFWSFSALWRPALQYNNKREYYSRIPRLSNILYSASVNAKAKIHNFSGISIDIGEQNEEKLKNCLKVNVLGGAWSKCFWYTNRK